ncbi:NAD(P)/FAD-dependent oxidoreductase [Weissella coleopterorum]|uniref:NAD(P)/FAD-dependent oxidoreductase n=1 Tax=Weissella coleopterorum TaxID=2714949 RepID=UPI0024833600|nr:FAD-dependent oxidoreductase [Weissella coleopterorum]
MDQATSLRVHIEEIIRQGAIELDEDLHHQKLRLVVVGGGYLGIQILGELLDERRILAKANQLRPREIELILVEAHGEILTDLDDIKTSHKVENYLKHQGVKVRKNITVTEIFEDHLALDDGTQIMTNTVVWAGGTQGRTQMGDLNLQQDEARKVRVNPEMRILDEADIYALGDSVVQPLPDQLSNGQGAETLMPKRGENRYFWPQNVHTAVNQADKVGNNVAVKLLDHGDLNAFKPRRQRIFISVGSRYGVAVFKNRFTMTGFWAHDLKHLSNLHFLAQLGSNYQMYRYLQREIFSTPQHIISGQGNVSNVGNTLWSVPLRLATGIFLIITGVAVGGGIGSVFAGVGLALFVGFMTTLAGFMTFLLSLVMLGTSFSISALLLPFVGIALMNGAGRSFGLDYWLVPFIQKNLGILITGDSQAGYNDLDEK